MKTYHIISNPTAGKNKSSKNLKKVQDYFQRRGVPFVTHISMAERDATEIARRLTSAGENDLIVLGGDGTLHEVLNGIVDPTACRLGLIPSGTGNDFAEKIGVPMDAEKACEMILDGQTKPTDYLEVSGVRCMNVAGLGMDVDVLERCRKGKLKGKIKYLMCLVQSLFAFKGYKVEFEVNGETQTRDVLIAAVCNGSQFGGGVKICPTAQVDDGKLDAIVIDCIGGKIKIIKAFIELMKGRVLEYPLTQHILCESIRFIPQNECTVQLDGELYKNLEFTATVRQGLNFYRP
jgi:YegS/Rv2252/BmrU family lipid kinase